MASDYLSHKANGNGISTSLSSSLTNPALASRSNALSSKVSSLLSASYADIEIRDALSLIDERNIENNAQTRRQLRLDVQREVIESNGVIIKEFGHVAEVRNINLCHLITFANLLLATQAYRCYHCNLEQRLR